MGQLGAAQRKARAILHRLRGGECGSRRHDRRRSSASLSSEEIARYVDAEQPFDCAGGFKVEALGISLFERMDTHDPTALIGLPLIWLAAALRNRGFEVP